MNDIPYVVSIDTKSNAGYITAISISIEKIVIDLDEKVRVDLCDHPMYADLQKYVLSNQR